MFRRHPNTYRTLAALIFATSLACASTMSMGDTSTQSLRNDRRCRVWYDVNGEIVESVLVKDRVAYLLLPREKLELATLVRNRILYGGRFVASLQPGLLLFGGNLIYGIRDDHVQIDAVRGVRFDFNRACDQVDAGVGAAALLVLGDEGRPEAATHSGPE